MILKWYEEVIIIILTMVTSLGLIDVHSNTWIPLVDLIVETIIRVITLYFIYRGYTKVYKWLKNKLSHTR